MMVMTATSTPTTLLSSEPMVLARCTRRSMVQGPQCRRHPAEMRLLEERAARGDPFGDPGDDE